MNIDYGKIVTNALSALVAAVFVGAAAIVWKAATSIDDRIKVAKEDILKQQAALKATLEIFAPELATIKNQINEMDLEIKSIGKLPTDAKAVPDGVTYNAGEPIILKEFEANRQPDWQQKELERLKEAIDVRQDQIYQAIK